MTPARQYSRKKVHFGSETSHAVQKERVFTALLKSHLISLGYIVATPEPDLGDDLWFVKREEFRVRRGQIKSAHSMKSDGREISANYCVKIQTRNLIKQVGNPDFVFFVALADDQFHGIGEGCVEGDEYGSVLRIDESRLIRTPVDRSSLGVYSTKSHVNQKFQSKTTGFHFGCLPSDVFAVTKPKDNDREKSFWINVERIETGAYKYQFKKQNVTKYFGQALTGLEAT